MTGWMTRAAVAAVLVLTMQMTGDGQAGSAVTDLAAKLRERFDIVALQQGVALVPRQAGSGVRLIQVEGGVVAVDGQTLTGAQLRERLAGDADLVVQVSFLTPQQQRELAGAPAPAAPPSIERTNVVRGDRVRFGGDITVGRDERIEGDVVTVGGALNIDGEVTGDAVSVGGALTLGPDAVIRGDAVAVGAGLKRAPTARIEGEIVEVGGGPGGFGRGRMMSSMFGSFWSRLGSLAATLLRVGLLVLLGVVVVAFGRNAVERIASRTAATPVRSGLIGLLAEILFIPVLVLTCVVLVVSIVGIPLLALVPFAVLLLMLVMLVGFVGLAFQIGGRLAARLGWTSAGPYAAVVVGVVAIGAATLVAKLAGLAGGFLVGAPLAAVGYFIEYVAWTVGFGAALLYWYETQTRFGPRRGVTPATPAAPSPSEA
ncbi:MAG: polymer-forming cytoskeletal protein [Acidobacteria bacterium]|nr:polymer-forming cytoskeletal protein [Acidobacteriota bacterium]